MRLHPFDETRMGHGVVARHADRVMGEIAGRDLLADVAQSRETAKAESRAVAEQRFAEIDRRRRDEQADDESSHDTTPREARLALRAGSCKHCAKRGAPWKA